MSSNGGRPKEVVDGTTAPQPRAGPGGVGPGGEVAAAGGERGDPARGDRPLRQRESARSRSPGEDQGGAHPVDGRPAGRPGGRRRGAEGGAGGAAGGSATEPCPPCF